MATTSLPHPISALSGDKISTIKQAIVLGYDYEDIKTQATIEHRNDSDIALLVYKGAIRFINQKKAEKEYAASRELKKKALQPRTPKPKREIPETYARRKFDALFK